MQTFGNIEEGNSFGTNCGCNILSIHNKKTFSTKELIELPILNCPMNWKEDILCEKENY